MNLKILSLSLLMLFSNWIIYAKKEATLTTINRPYYLRADDNQIYISEPSAISIFHLSNFKLVKKFGQTGEGPSEFKHYPMIEILPQGIVVNTYGKMLVFSKDGKFLNEKRKSLFNFHTFPVGNNFVTLTRVIKPKLKSLIILLDKDFKVIKEIGSKESKTKRRDIEATKDYFMYCIEDDKIFLGDTAKGFLIEVFDGKGNKLYQIKKNYKPLKVTETFKNRVLKKLKNTKNRILKSANRRGYKAGFKEYFPAFEFIRVTKGKIYAFTFNFLKSEREVLIFDLKGNLQNRVFVPDVSKNRSCISNDKFYYLKENEDAEEWELFSVDL